mmetsp:Transcript_16378/g.25444  ORF Transcript_16378/g.25444 Transcript_16378/m.25444 type:complete len:530 (-) Transcript_16378:597-2186(-)
MASVDLLVRHDDLSIFALSQIFTGLVALDVKRSLWGGCHAPFRVLLDFTSKTRNVVGIPLSPSILQKSNSPVSSEGISNSSSKLDLFCLNGPATVGTTLGIFLRNGGERVPILRNVITSLLVHNVQFFSVCRSSEQPRRGSRFISREAKAAVVLGQELSCLLATKEGSSLLAHHNTPFGGIPKGSRETRSTSVPTCNKFLCASIPEHFTSSIFNQGSSNNSALSHHFSLLQKVRFALDIEKSASPSLLLKRDTPVVPKLQIIPSAGILHQRTVFIVNHLPFGTFSETLSQLSISTRFFLGQKQFALGVKDSNFTRLSSFNRGQIPGAVIRDNIVTRNQLSICINTHKGLGGGGLEQSLVLITTELVEDSGLRFEGSNGGVRELASVLVIFNQLLQTLVFCVHVVSSTDFLPNKPQGFFHGRLGGFNVLFNVNLFLHFLLDGVFSLGFLGRTFRGIGSVEEKGGIKDNTSLINVPLNNFIGIQQFRDVKLLESGIKNSTQVFARLHGGESLHVDSTIVNRVDKSTENHSI